MAVTKAPWGHAALPCQGQEGWLFKWQWREVTVNTVWLWAARPR